MRSIFCAGLMAPLTVLLLLASLASATTVNLNPVADTFVSSANAANDYGGAGALAVSAPDLAKGEFQSLLRFDLAGAKSGFDTTFGAGQWSVGSVSLQLTAAAPIHVIFNASAGGNFYIGWMANDTWIEGVGTPNAPGATGITWNSLPTYFDFPNDQTVGVYNFTGATSGLSSYALAPKLGLINDVLAGQLMTLRLVGLDAMSGLFNSRSFGTAASRPVLSVTAVAVPEPSAVVFAALGLCGLVACWRRARRGLSP